jgi:Holliday junction resolvasome RuvABC endonuclease subunit
MMPNGFYNIMRYDLQNVSVDEKLTRWEAFIRQAIEGMDAVLIELPIVPRNPAAAGASIILHKIAGIIEVAVKEAGIPFRQVAGARLKKWARGEGVADKKRVKELARERWGKVIRTDNEADAAWLGDIGYHWLSGTDPVIRRRQEVLIEVAKEPEQVRGEAKAVKAAKKARAAAIGKREATL